MLATKHRRNEIDSSITTQRWSINNRDLAAGESNSLAYIQNDIVNKYNDHLDRNGLLRQYELKEHHIPMININTSQRFVRGKPTLIVDFIDPCDGVTSILWYMDHDPFAGHNFKEEIPNPKTREKATTNKEYEVRTLNECGLWKRKPRIPKL